MRLAERSAAACAMISWHEQLYLAWTGSDMHVNLASSSDGREITGKQRLSQRSYRTQRVPVANTTTAEDIPLTPSLAASGDRLYLAWTDTGSLSVLAAEQPVRAAPVTLAERSGNGPSLATGAGDSLVLAWTGTDDRVNLLTLAGDEHGTVGPVAGTKLRLEEARSGQTPAVCSHEGSLILAWTGRDRHVNFLAGAGSQDGAPVRLEVARGSAPALCSHQGSLILAWTGGDRHVNFLAGAGSQDGAPVRLEEARSSQAPALCSHQGSLILAWTGTDGHLNLARLP